MRVMTLAAVVGSISFAQGAAGQPAPARVSVEERVIRTYPFSSPNRVPILVSDARLYPYHRFDGYAHEAVDRPWTVVHLQNEWIEAWVLPEVGGKVWGARIKASGHEFIYRNEVLKFRNIALRGPWTSGGIEFNFGVIGHTPATATPVDWTTRENEDGSVSVFVGTMDLPSRTTWRVEIRLPADRAYLETRVRWHNPTSVEQPYYNWMTAAAFARDDLVMSIPGTAYLDHPGSLGPWPEDDEGRRLPVYDENRFGGNKSFHVVGAFEDFFGGYYVDSGWGFGHWARYEDMPGQKLWLWALSRQGGIWEDLLTDDDGQYIEFQAGRLLVQYSPTGAVNPVSEVGFDPGAFDRWSETWFPVQDLGGLTDASRDAVMSVRRDDERLEVRVHALGALRDTLRVLADGREVLVEAVDFAVLEPRVWTLDAPESARVQVELPALGLSWGGEADARVLDRPLTTPPEAPGAIPETDRAVEEASELAQGRRLSEARRRYAWVLEREPWNREALLGMADLEHRRGRYEEGLAFARRALALDAYDADANFSAGRLYRALGRTMDAREAFGWSARSMDYRAVSYLRLAELALSAGDLRAARRYAELASDYDRHSPTVARIRALIARLDGDGAEAERAALERNDPLDHFVRAERYLDADAGPGAAAAFTAALRGEYPEQELLELVVTYGRWARGGDAVALMDAAPELAEHPMLRAWRAALTDDGPPAPVHDPSFVFPFRAESLPVLEAAARESAHWAWTYLLALNLWARDRVAEAARLLASLEDEPDFAPFYVVRASVAGSGEAGEVAGRFEPETDLRRAVTLDPGDRALWVPLLRYLQDQDRHEDALVVSGDAVRRFPQDFDLALLHVTSLVRTGRAMEALRILDGLDVLPSENSGVAHRLFAEAHTLAGLDAFAAGRPAEAIGHFQAATTWPERLGQGRPYQPEERLQQYLTALALEAQGRAVEARDAFRAVVEATPPRAFRGGAIDRNDLLGAAALDALGRSGELESFGDAEGALDRLAAAVRGAAPGRLAQALVRALGESGEIFADVEGGLIRRALQAGSAR